MNAKNFTTTMSPETLEWLSAVSKESGKTRREIIEEALAELRRKQEQDTLRQAYTKLKDDTEWTQIAEEGIADWPQHE